MRYLTTLALVLSAALAGCQELQGPGSPARAPAGFTLPNLGSSLTSDLIADGGDGIGIDIGSVTISQSGFELTVTYEVDVAGWCLVETHFEVANDLEGIPQKNGNPRPGQFRFGADDLGCVTSYSETVDLLAYQIGSGEIVIATHAAVISPIDECTETVWQIGDVESLMNYDPDGSGSKPAMDLLTNYADEFNWSTCTPPATATSAGPNLVSCQPSYTSPFVIGTTPTNEFPYNSNYSRGYATDFTVDWSGALYFGGDLTVSWSPGQSETEKKVVSSGDGIATTTFTAFGQPTPDQGWFLDTYPLVEHSVAVDPLADGTHTIRFQHTQGDGTFWDWLKLTKPCEREESAWGAGTDFPGKNWAMYLTYTWMIIGGWNDARGDLSAFPTTDAFSLARAAIEANYGVVYKSFGTLDSDLSTVDIAILGSVRQNESGNPISALSSLEQAALENFVEQGGCAILLTDGTSFNSGNNSLTAPFGLETNNGISGQQVATVIDNSVTDKTSYTTNFPGYYSDTDGSGTKLAEFGTDQIAAVWFPIGTFVTGSGPVFAFSDINMFWNTADNIGGAFFADNEDFFLDVIAACFTE